MERGPGPQQEVIAFWMTEGEVENFLENGSNDVERGNDKGKFRAR